MPVHCVYAVAIHGIKKPEITNHFSRLLDGKIVPSPHPGPAKKKKKGKTLLDIILMFWIIGMVVSILFEAA